MKTIQLKFNVINREIFEAIKTGKKKVETRAGTVKYQKIEKGDEIVFICGKEKFAKKAKKITFFNSIPALLKKYKPSQINPKTKTAKETEAMYYSFPGYREKIKKFGLVAIDL